MRILSLSPAATEWLQAFDSGHQLLVLPAASEASPVDSSRERASNPFLPPRIVAPSEEMLSRLSPDLLVVGTEAQAEAVAGKGGFDVFRFCPTTLPDVLKQVLGLARRCDATRVAMRHVGEMERGLALEQRRADISRKQGSRGSVLVLTSLAPLCAGGYWCADLVEQAGATIVVPAEGKPPAPLTLEEMHRLAPDRILVAAAPPAGAAALELPDSLRARVHVLPPAMAFFQPTPRLYDTIHYLIRLFSPE